jgi:hypothetical protein
MSTTIKRVALVAVAALGLGVLTVTPSQATASAADFSVSSPTASQLTGETGTATSTIATLSYYASANTDTTTITVSLLSAKNTDGTNMTTGLVQPKLDVYETAAAQVKSDLSTTIAKYSVAGAASVANDAPAIVVPTGSAVAVAKVRVWLNAPTVAGTYVVRVTPAVPASGSTAVALTGATYKDITITVTAAPADDLVATTATSIISAADTNTAVADEIVTASKASTWVQSSATQTQAALIRVTQKNKSALTISESYTAEISGAGTLGIGRFDGLASIPDTYTSVGRALTLKGSDSVLVFADGTSGVGTITIKSKAGLVLATETVTFFGDATSIVTTSQSTVLYPGVSNDGAGTTADRPLKVVVKDAAGTVVSNAALKVTGETSTIVSDSYASNCTFVQADGAYYCSVTAGVAGKTRVTVGTKTSATDTTATNLNGNAVEVRVGSTTAASVTVAADKSSYAPGEKATISVTLLDKDGLVVAGDGTTDYASIFATGGISTDFVLGSSSDTTTATSLFDVTGGVKKYTVYMPQNTGAITFTYKTAGTAVTGTAPSALSGLAVANQAVTSTFSVTVSNPGVDAATDAANEATDAANAATDAALAAADAADAATAAAQDASDAVAALSATVAKLVASLKAQITSLTNLVIKIQKKVKA